MKLGDARSGLSLFDLLIALALLSVIAAGLGSAMGLAVRLFERTGALVESSTELAMRVRFRNLAANATAPAQIAAFPILFSGERARASFVTLQTPAGLADAAALSIELQHIDQRLTLEIASLHDNGEVFRTDRYDLAIDVSDAVFSYFDSATNPPTWTDNWDDENRLPSLFRIEIAEGSMPNWPEFTVRLLNAP